MLFRSRRYTFLVADPTSGVVRRVTVSLRTALLVAGAALVTPILIGLGAKWSAQAQIDQLRNQNATLEVENGNFRTATGELTTQIQSLETVIEDLGARSVVDPEQARVMQKLPAVVKAKAAGGNSARGATIASLLTPFTNPEDTFGLLRDVLGVIETRLNLVRRDVERREKLAAATPSIWPAPGWLTGYFGGRPDPFTGEREFHQGLDISTEKGTPVFATADGTVESASWNGDYGNFIVIQHEFGLTTRYGHLNSYRVSPGDTVKRGDTIGYVGSTGRSTGAHLHYEILANGQLINPLSLLTQPANR